MRILLLEDDRETTAAIEKGLGREGHCVTTSATVAAAIRFAQEQTFDLAVLDIMLPDGSGYDVLERIRREPHATQVLMLTARGSIADRVDGLDRGADDFLVKPFSFAELAARVRALARRKRPSPLFLRCGALELDLSRRLAIVGDTKLDLTPIQFNLLSVLMRSRSETVQRRELLAEVWDYDFDPHTNLVEVHINRLRRKLEQAGVGDLIRTVRGEGYSIE